MINRILFLAAVIAGLATGPAAVAEPSRASQVIGGLVLTADGELLGRVEDIAVDIGRNQVDYVVVSIGSFLVEDNLIAVHPDALGSSEDGRYLVVYSDDLDNARRFGAENWPVSADVLPGRERQAISGDDIVAAEGALQSVTGDRLATISDGRRTATMKAGERTAQIEAVAGQRKMFGPADGGPGDKNVDDVRYKRFVDGNLPGYMADSEFERLDENRDGYLSRSEIGERLQSNIRYRDYDVDGNDGIDPFEFQLLKEGA